MPTGPILITH